MSEKLEEQQRQTAELLGDVAKMVSSMDPTSPGLALRVDRLERRNQFLFGGNILSLAGAFWAAWRLADALDKSGGL